MADVLTIRETALRAKEEGLPVSEYTVRQWVRSGAIPTRKVGQKALLFYPNLVRYLKCEDFTDKQPATVAVSGIRRVEL